MIDKAIATLILILAAIVNLPLLFKFIWAAFQLQKEYNESKEEEKND
jgi:hypothetical protein